jgi:hypothetical protein
LIHSPKILRVCAWAQRRGQHHDREKSRPQWKVHIQDVSTARVAPMPKAGAATAARVKTAISDETPRGKPEILQDAAHRAHLTCYVGNAEEHTATSE